MPKCDLKIDLDQPGKAVRGGETIRGVVRVDCDADVNCKALEVTCGWRTHGRGNVDSGKEQTATLFAGQWRAGTQAEYPFELRVASWPPSFQGHYLNIEHFVSARAKIPWAFDPKTSETFVTQCSNMPPEEKSSSVNTVAGCGVSLAVVGSIGFFVTIFATILFQNLGAGGGFLLLLPIALVVAFKLLINGLPKLALGKVDCLFESQQMSPGGRLRGELVIANRRKVKINRVLLTLCGQEVCVSGSGSSRTTHRKVIFEEKSPIGVAAILKPGDEHRFPIDVQLPDDAPLSVSLRDNEITWEAIVRVDIPLWPDWVRKTKLFVIPPQHHAATDAQPIASTNDPSAATDEVTLADSVGSGGITFAETVDHLWNVREDDEQRSRLLEAITGMPLEVSVIVERRLLYSGDDHRRVYPDGHAIWARYADPELPITLYVPKDWGDQFEQISGQPWTGTGTVVGWDERHGRLLIKWDS